MDAEASKDLGPHDTEQLWISSAVTHRTTKAHLYVTVVLPVLIDGTTDDAAPDGSFWIRETFSATAIAQLLFLSLLLLLVQQCYIDSVYC